MQALAGLVSSEASVLGLRVGLQHVSLERVHPPHSSGTPGGLGWPGSVIFPEHILTRHYQERGVSALTPAGLLGSRLGVSLKHRFWTCRRNQSHRHTKAVWNSLL